ncbi:hypothetical protein ACX80O_04565 [Arthrobacter sp. Hz1]
MTGTFGLRTVFALSRTAVTFLGFVAIIVGILAMHVWMGGHGASTHGAPAQGASAHGAALPASSTTSNPGFPTSVSGENRVPANNAHAAYPDGPAGTGEMGEGCGGSCGNDGGVLGMCLLAVIVVAVLAFLLRSGRLVPGSVLLRGPPLIRLRTLSIPAPSLIQLCISRT